MLEGAGTAPLDRLGTMVGRVTLLENHACAADRECHVTGPDSSLKLTMVAGPLPATIGKVTRHARIHLQHARCPQGARGQGCPRQCHAELSPRGEDRCRG